eukprot:NODE_494_length_2181_cov_30.641651_g454_i0.p1 GENE.NODE_494_length_2181_cov_30.641651_g454_i0~~NODE_494_length_2181_cov_30.641651_g454_i0.p1  ORF type:complete len:667 (+),score=89.84 NODE_494_length_2181_cov_30.641651_g454_i0:98-2098(+)
MGNHVSIDGDPPEICELSRARSKNWNSTFSSNIKVWKLSEAHESISCKAMQLMIERALEPECSYLILHTYRNNLHVGATVDSAQRKSETNGHAKIPKALLTPRGLAHSFASSVDASYSFHMYACNGTQSTEMVKAMAAVKGVELERTLKKEGLDAIFSCGNPIAVTNCSWFQLGSSRSFDSPRCHFLSAFSSMRSGSDSFASLLGHRFKDPAPTKVWYPGASPFAASPTPPLKLGLDLRAVSQVGPSPTNDRQRRLEQFAKVASEIEPFLFVGAELPSRDSKLLKSLGITHIINAAAMICPNHFPDEFSYFAVNLLDSPDEDILSMFPALLSVIEKVRRTGGKVYVHCHQGVSRSCTTVIAYLMWRDGIGYEEGYQKVRRIRGICSPNSGFIASLLRWQKHLANPPPLQLFRFTPFTERYPLPFVLREEGSVSADSRVLGGHCQPPPVAIDQRAAYALFATGSVFIWKGSQCLDAAYEQACEILPVVQEFYYRGRQRIVPQTVHESRPHPHFLELLRRFHPGGIKMQIIPEYDRFYCKELFSKVLTGPAVPATAVPHQAAPQPDAGFKEGTTEMYSFPDFELLTQFDSDDLLDDVTRILAQCWRDSVKVYVWVGEKVRVRSTAEHGEHAASRFLEAFPPKPGTQVSIKIILQGEETDEFDDLFENG